jgi:DNA-binding NarL/FixJ family response regulator
MRVLVVDDHRLVIDALRRTLDAAEGFEVVGTTHAGTRVLDLVEEACPDVVLMDIHMPDLDGLSVLDQLQEHHPDVKVVMISAGADASEIRSALQRGASGYLVKSINPADIPSALRQAVEGTTYYAAAAGETATTGSADGGSTAAPDGDAAGAELARRTGLTPRELEILTAVVRGLSNRDIAKELWVTEQTVKFHLSNVYRKLGVANRTGAVRLGLGAGIDADADEPAA